ncbi:MAG: GTP cyclohydrolase II [Candidatus Acidiferrales bacterium]
MADRKNRKTRRVNSRKGARNSTRKGARIVARAKFPTEYGQFTILGIEGAEKLSLTGTAESAVALQHGKIRRGDAPLVRIHSQCLTGDVFHSQRCDCRAQLEMALRETARARCGIVLYLPQEGRGIGLMNKLKAYELQDRGMDTVEANRELGFEADHRDYKFCAEALKLLGAKRVKLLSNNPDKVAQLERNGVRVIERVPCRPRTSRHSRDYLKTKREKLGHILDEV